MGETQAADDGSSPWARGTHLLAHSVGLMCRFIPVGTGNTSFLIYVKKIKEVHPRGHGEHRGAIEKSEDISGSSPWARGTPITMGASVYASRFIPVGTGNTAPASAFAFGLAVHPRGHGEHP